MIFALYRRGEIFISCEPFSSYFYEYLNTLSASQCFGREFTRNLFHNYVGPKSNAYLCLVYRYVNNLVIQNNNNVNVHRNHRQQTIENSRVLNVTNRRVQIFHGNTSSVRNSCVIRSDIENVSLIKTMCYKKLFPVKLYYKKIIIIKTQKNEPNLTQENL